MKIGRSEIWKAHQDGIVNNQSEVSLLGLQFYRMKVCKLGPVKV